MSEDESERINLANENPEIVAKMIKLLEKQVREGRSTIGNAQTNDENVKIVIHKGVVKKN